MKNDPLFQNLRELREEQGLSQKELGKIIGFSQRELSHIEVGSREMTYSLLIELASYFGTSVDYIMDLTDNRSAYEPSLKYKLWQERHS